MFWEKINSLIVSVGYEIDQAYNEPFRVSSTLNTSFFFFLRYEAFGGAGDGKSLHSVTFTPGQRVTLA